MFAITRHTAARAVLAGVIAVAPVTVVTAPAQADVVNTYTVTTPVDNTATLVDNDWGIDKLFPPGSAFFPPGWGIPPGQWKKLLPFGSFGSF